ncbi:Competence protein F homolog,phosphoribosyltransferase domain; protein YhgH required for utilization of DNA as sole source of carbon and energy [Pseudoalteromonas luteoviolacea B = ATCC 29581]|nr:Competence protein F homolog,phosphoribosyltransferase domain; protein YhgH required for utilization of DNA as sole source of carbon and energy [Pseudoalteromonas luteoviolacea B = ATCC 29581]
MTWFSSLFQARCAQCHTQLASSHGLCATCRADFPLFDLETWPNLLHCPEVTKQVALPHCDGLFSCGYYEHDLAKWLRAFKFEQQTQCRWPIQDLLSIQLNTWAQHVDIPRFDCVFAIPLHPFRFWHRGYNQTTQLWKNRFPISTTSAALCRSQYTKTQTRLGKLARKQNMKHAFTLKGNIEGKYVAIIDDVVTTGATLDSAAQVCLEAGAKSVWGMSIALTPHHARYRL